MISTLQDPFFSTLLKGAKEAADILKNKLTATIAQKPETMGRMAIETAARYFRGEKIPVKLPVELTLIEQKKK